MPHKDRDGQVANSSSIQRTVIIPRRSKRVPEGLCDQAISNPGISAAIRSKDIDDSTARGFTRKRNVEDSSSKSRKKGTRTESFEGRCKQIIDFIKSVLALPCSLEILGFKWNVHETFEQRCHDLEALKSEFGPYNVTKVRLPETTSSNTTVLDFLECQLSLIQVRLY